MVRIGIVFVVAGLGALWYQTLRSIDEGHWIGVSLWDLVESLGGGRPYTGIGLIDQMTVELLRLPPTLTLTLAGFVLIALAWAERRRQKGLGGRALDEIHAEARERRALLREESNMLRLGRRLHKIGHHAV